MKRYGPWAALTMAEPIRIDAPDLVRFGVGFLERRFRK